MAVTVNTLPLCLLCSVATLTLSWPCSPLHLTPLLEQHKAGEARELSRVTDPDNIVPESYAGFITVDKELGNHYFFWFFPIIQGPKPDIPLLIWLNGGPGITSMLGLLYENGPIKLTTLPNGNVSYERRETSWSKAFSMLYIDNPVQVGYSYSDRGDGGLKNQDGYTADLYNFMEQFYGLFYEFSFQKLYIGGQSYAGKFVPSLAYLIHQQIKAGKSKIPLAGIYIGGPFFDPETASSGYIDYVYALGAISHAQMDRDKKAQAEFFENYRQHNDSVPFTSFNIMLPWYKVAAVDNYIKPESAPYDEVANLMSSTRFRKALHIGDSCKFRSLYDEDVWLVRNVLEPDIAASVKDKLAVLMDNYKVLIFNGEFDGIVTSNGIEAGLLSTPWSLQAQYNASERSVWYAEDREDNFDVHGFYQHVGQFCRVVIRGAGHQVPHDQPEVTLEMMRRFVENGCI